MSRILHLLNMSLGYGRSKGVRAYRQEEPPLGSLAAPCHLEESASHHNYHKRIYSFTLILPAIFPDTLISSCACIVLLSEASSSSHVE